MCITIFGAEGCVKADNVKHFSDLLGEDIGCSFMVRKRTVYGQHTYKINAAHWPAKTDIPYA